MKEVPSLQSLIHVAPAASRCCVSSQPALTPCTTPFSQPLPAITHSLPPTLLSLQTCEPAPQDSLQDSGATEEAMPEEVVMVVAYCYLIPTLVSINIFTNLLNVVILSSLGRRQQRPQQQGQATTFRYLLWLAITDVVVSLFLVVALSHLERSDLPYGWAFYYAHMEIPILNALTSGSAYIMVGLSVDRFVAVCYPRRYCGISAPRLANIRIGLSLLVPVLLYIPHGFSQKVICNTQGSGWTYDGAEMDSDIKWFVWEVMVELFHRLIPASLLLFLNLRIICTFRKLMMRRKYITSKKEERDGKAQQEQHLVYMLVAIVTTFLLSNLPAAVLALIDRAGSAHGPPAVEVFRAVANSLEAFGSSLNFVLYFCFVPDVRQEMLRLLQGVQGGARGVLKHAKTSYVCSDSITNDRSSKETECEEI
ncbi:probable G-protein coupled receptor AH9.1 isoform X1 [Scylla paramamosain]|uniref:probable G-protein coupled receptor AH9.1 isoform X1 n=1 Tax=Scylla paramamosain TaxID=85552 RepID=UPI003082A9D8